MADMICKRAHSSTTYGNLSVGDPYTLDSEAKADHHEKIGLGERVTPKAPAPKKPAKKSGEAAMAAITGQKK